MEQSGSEGIPFRFLHRHPCSIKQYDVHEAACYVALHCRYTLRCRSERWAGSLPTEPDRFFEDFSVLRVGRERERVGQSESHLVRRIFANTGLDIIAYRG